MTGPVEPQPVLTETGHVERRRVRYITVEEFSHWRNRATAAFAILTAVSCLAAYLAYDAGKDSAAGLERNSRAAAIETCRSGGELRIAISDGVDRLRSLAVSAAPNTPAGRKVRREFIARTQPAIDALLSQAAGRPYKAPIPPGSVTAKVRQDVTRLSNIRCDRRVETSFG